MMDVLFDPKIVFDFYITINNNYNNDYNYYSVQDHILKDNINEMK